MKTARSLPQPTRGLRSLTRPSSNRISRLQCLRSQALHPRPHPHPHPQQQCRTFLGGGGGSRNPSYRAEENLNVERLHDNARGYYMRRQYFLLVGAAVSLSVFCYTAYLLEGEMRKPKRCDAGGLPSGKVDPFTDEAGSKRKTVIHDADGRELVPTGDSTVPTFPRVLGLDSPSSTASSPTQTTSSYNASPNRGQEHINGVEYTLVGLGTRTVSMFGIRVYVVGFYVATQDIAAIQARLVREINPIASTLIPSEKEELRRALLDPAEGEQLWSEILATVRPRSLFRIVPVRDTNFHHLRDGFVRAIQARTSSTAGAGAGGKDEFGDEAFGAAMRDFKAVFNRGNVPKNGELLLSRDGSGELVVTYDDGKKKKGEKEEKSDGGSASGTIGRVADERISRLLWLNYLAGSKVASEPARNNIVDGIMEFVERPIGTVATQVL